MPAKIEPGMRTMSATLKTGKADATLSREAQALTATTRDAWKAKFLQFLFLLALVAIAASPLKKNRLRLSVMRRNIACEFVAPIQVKLEF